MIREKRIKTSKNIQIHIYRENFRFVIPYKMVIATRRD